MATHSGASQSVLRARANQAPMATKTRISSRIAMRSLRNILRLQARDGPGAADKRVLVFACELASPARTVVNAIVALHPQFDGIYPQAVTTPMRRARDVHVPTVGIGRFRRQFPSAEAGSGLCDCIQQLRARGDRLTLLARPGAD